MTKCAKCSQELPAPGPGCRLMKLRWRPERRSLQRFFRTPGPLAPNTGARVWRATAWKNGQHG